MHPMSLGGAQASILLQKKHLEQNGARVTVFSAASASAVVHPDFVVMPSIPITLDREYSLVVNFKKALRRCEAQFENQHFDLVHVQGDFWGASLGTAMAKKYRLPLLVTSHTNIEYGIRKALGNLLSNAIIRAMSKSLIKIAALGPTQEPTSSGWQYLKQVHSSADVSFAPSKHFAKALKDAGVENSITVLPTGVDDEEISKVVKTPRVKGSPARLIWAGRFLTEKRILPALEAFAQAKNDSSLVVYGSGPLEKLARAFVRTRGLSHRVQFVGRVSHQEMLQAFADADALLQTSMGFETQGLTVYESVAVGTPVILCDSNIALELEEGHHWLDESGTVSGLAETINKAVIEIEESEPDSQIFQPNSEFLQSTFTKRVLGFYAEAISRGSKTAQ